MGIEERFRNLDLMVKELERLDKVGVRQPNYEIFTSLTLISTVKEAIEKIKENSTEPYRSYVMIDVYSGMKDTLDDLEVYYEGFDWYHAVSNVKHQILAIITEYIKRID